MIYLLWSVLPQIFSVVIQPKIDILLIIFVGQPFLYIVRPPFATFI